LWERRRWGALCRANVAEGDGSCLWATCGVGARADSSGAQVWEKMELTGRGRNALQTKGDTNKEILIHRVIPVVAPNKYTASSATSPPPQSIRIAGDVNVAGAVSAVLVVKVHVAPSAGTWTVSCRNSARSADDPAIHFDAVASIASVAISGSQNLWLVALGTPIGEQVDVYLEMASGTSSATITFSADLIIRDA
jgi:hypothetical protein